MSLFVCPYCFNQTDSNVLWFQCANPNCVQRDPVRTRFELGYAPEGKVEARLFPTVFRKSATNILLRACGVRNPHKVSCPRCGETTSIRVCPHCHSPFPHGIDSLSNVVIAIIGAKETGKSHYIAVLIDRIYEMHDQFDWALMAFDDETMRRYEEEFRKPLYDRKTTLQITPKAAQNADVRKPLLYTLGLSEGRRNKTITLAFFDTAGEDMNDEMELRRYAPYIYNAAGIILLLDPLQQPSLRNQLPPERVHTLPQSIRSDANTSAAKIINRTVNLIHTKRDIPRNKKISIPLAVAFSKTDEFHDVLGRDAPIYRPSRHDGHFNTREFEDIDAFIRNWVGHFDPQFFQGTACFADTGFFGVSALGAPPNETQLSFKPRPERVEDPFLWLLWKNKFIRGW